MVVVTVVLGPTWAGIWTFDVYTGCEPQLPCTFNLLVLNIFLLVILGWFLQAPERVSPIQTLCSLFLPLPPQELLLSSNVPVHNSPDSVTLGPGETRYSADPARGSYQSHVFLVEGGVDNLQQFALILPHLSV